MTEPKDENQEDELIAVFGEARLLRTAGRLELRGGSMSDRTEALEWLSIFMPDAVATVKRR